MAGKDKKILVVGGGIGGMTTALEAAEAGHQVLLIEKEPSLGGRVSRFYQYFPKLCPPLCGLEMNYRRLRPNKNIQVLTSAMIDKIEGEAPDFKVSLRISPTYVNAKCVSCDECAKVCPSMRPNDFNYGMDETKAAYLPFSMAYPHRYVIDRDRCAEGCSKCAEVCQYQAVDLGMTESFKQVEAATIVFATGWKPYDASRIPNLGFGEYKNLINNVMMERLAAQTGPTAGKILRPSDGQAPKSVAFVQCAGSRDENHLNYCSSICCLASLKQAAYIREANPDTKITIFYIDIRTPGKYEDFGAKITQDPLVDLIKGKVAKITQGQNGNLVLEAEDMDKGVMIRLEVDLAVLATGMQPSMVDEPHLSSYLKMDKSGFLPIDLQKPGIYSAGVAKMPLDVTNSVQDSTGAALKAVQTINQG